MRSSWRSTATDAAIVLMGCAVLLTATLGVVDRRQTAATPTTKHIVIDAGHGGADGGAVAADGTEEKHLNLAVALPLRDLLSVMGYEVSMTRETDVKLNTERVTLRERKISDMKQRLSMVQSADLTVSIHQNKFSQERYSGTQVFYSDNHPQSAQVAEQIRASVVSLLQPQNTRPLKVGDRSVYLLSRATQPIVLVECGFLSNTQEREKLKNPTYQRQLALAVAGGVMKGLT